MTNPDINPQRLTDMFTHRSTHFADACELVEISVRAQLAAEICDHDWNRYNTILTLLQNQPVAFLVTWLANTCGELITTLAEHSHTPVDQLMLDLHQSAAATIDKWEQQLKDSGYLQ